MALRTTGSAMAGRVRFGTLTRARGKCLILLEGVEDAEALDCEVSGPRGVALPGRVTTTERGDSVLVVPVVPFDVRVDLYRETSDGRRALVASRIVRELGASLRSKANAFVRNPRATALRSSDSLLVEDGVSFDVLAGDGDNEILRGKVMFSLEEGDLRLVQPVEVIALDRSTGQVLSGEWCCLGDAAPMRKNYPGVCERVVDYSLRMPRLEHGLIVWARFALGGDTIGFAVLFEEWRDSLRADWAARTLFADRDPAYEPWFLEHHRTAEREISLQRSNWSDLAEQPLFSIVVPLFRTPLAFLEEMASSVLLQSYPRLELILVNASPEDGELARAVEGLVARDERVRYILLEGNRGITENTNEGIRVATGDFLVFLDHDDTIEPDALYWYAHEVSIHPDTDLIYCDEDHLKDGHYVLPFFKPDWDLDLLRCENYVCHMLAVRRSLVMELPELPGREFDGSQDHNMTLVIGDQARHVAHVRRILYHWRIHEQSVAGAGIDQKPYALEAERIAVQNHLDRRGERSTAVMGGRIPTRVDVVYEFDEHPLVSIVIPNHNEAPVLRRCLDSLFSRLTWPNFEIVIVENGSDDPDTFALYEDLKNRFTNVRVVTCEMPHGFNFSRLINFGVDAARGEYLLLRNNDTEVISPDLLELMMGCARREDVGCVGAKLLYPDGLVQHAGVSTGRSFGPLHLGHLLPDAEAGYYECMVLPHQLSAVTAACLLTKRSVYREVGGLDEGLPVDYNDIDFCLKVRARNLAVVEQVNAKMFHYESVSRGMEKTTAQFESLVRALGIYSDRWGDNLVEGDPLHSSLFSFDDVYCKLDDGSLPLGATSLADFL